MSRRNGCTVRIIQGAWRPSEGWRSSAEKPNVRDGLTNALAMQALNASTGRLAGLDNDD
jgi:hypothetical protein